MLTQTQIKNVLLESIRDHERYIRNADIHIKRGKYGDYDMAEYELLEHIRDTFGDDVYWDFEYQQQWFKDLVWRQARCNWYETSC